MKSADFEKYSGVTALVIDMQPNYVKRMYSDDRQILIESQIEMLKFFAEQSIPVVVLEYVDRGKTIDELRPHILNVPVSKYLIKPDDDGFEKTSLLEVLMDLQTNRLVLMGLSASACVKSTAESAIKNGLKIYTARHLIANGTWARRKDKEDVPDWYEANGMFTEDYNDLFDILKKESL